MNNKVVYTENTVIGSNGFNKLINKLSTLRKKEEEEAAPEPEPTPEPEPEPTKEELLLTEIRDLLKQQQK